VHKRSRVLRRIAPAAVVVVISSGFAASPAAAGFFDFLFGTDGHAAHPQRSTFDPFGLNSAPGPAPARAPRTEIGHTTGYCVRSCDGRYFPVQARGGVSPAQVCQSFCPAAPTKVYFGGNIDNALSATGERYADSDNAYAYRKALKADCTCNGRDPTGLAPVDLSLDTTLRPGDIVATVSGLVAYSGATASNDQTSEFTPVANYPGLTADVRAKLGEMKVAPVSAGLADEPASPLRDDSRIAPTQGSLVPKTVSTRANRAELD
jgi:Protein of unknown function (DUF2865)